MDANCHLFDYEEENKLCYLDVFKNYRQIVESYLMRAINRAACNLSEFPMKDLERLLMSHGPNVSPLEEGEVVELILSLSDFVVFKELILDHKRCRTGEYDDFNLLQVVSMERR